LKAFFEVYGEAVLPLELAVNLLPGGDPPSPNAVLEVDNSDKGSQNGAVYKGMTSGEIEGKRFLYVANFRSARVEVYNTNFQRVRFEEDAFDDDTIPVGFAPFNYPEHRR
jgi:hypothetical protein